MNPAICSTCRNGMRLRLHEHLQILRSKRLKNLHRPLSSTSTPVLSWYWDTNEPSSDQLKAASHFFKTYPPHKLWTASEWRHQNNDQTSLTPEVVFLGRSNVGKSSLINAVLASPGLNRVGPRPGKTTLMHAWAIAAVDPRTGGALKGAGGDMDNKLTVLDMPGYGHASRSDWGNEIVTYLKRRKHLRRAFVLMDPAHGIKKHDEQIVQLLRSQGISHQVIMSKCDRVGQRSELDETMRAVRKYVHGSKNEHGALALGEILAVASLDDGTTFETSESNVVTGVANVQWAVLRAGGLEQLAMRTARRDKIIAEQVLDPTLSPADRLLQMLGLDDSALTESTPDLHPVRYLNSGPVRQLHSSGPDPGSPRKVQSTGPRRESNIAKLLTEKTNEFQNQSKSRYDRITSNAIAALLDGSSRGTRTQRSSFGEDQPPRNLRDTLFLNRSQQSRASNKSDEIARTPPLFNSSISRSEMSPTPHAKLDTAIPKSKGVGQGMDAFLAMTGVEEKNPKPTSKPGIGKRRKRNR